MATVWYCCECGNGPMGTNNNSSCSHYGCYHRRCGSCSVVEQDHFALDMGSNSPNLLAQAPTQTTLSTVVPASGQGGHTFTCSTHELGEPTDGGDYRWTCSECHADNSYHHDAACWDCQHWRCTSCSVYEVKPRK